MRPLPKFVDCPRLSRRIAEPECCQLVVSTERREDLTACMACEYGKQLAALCPYAERFAMAREEEGARRLLTAETALPHILAYALKRYPWGKNHGLPFLTDVAARVFGVDCGQNALREAAEKHGLHVHHNAGRDSIIIDAAARALAKQGEIGCSA